jgi:two-component system sensor kinase FixL
MARQAAVQRMQSLLEELSGHVSDDDTVRARLPALRQHLQSRMALLDAVLNARRRDGLEAAVRQLATSPGHEEMRQVQELVTEMEADLGQRLTQRQATAQTAATRALALLGVLLVLVATALLALYARIRRDARERRDSEERLRAVVETAGEGILTIDSAGRVGSFNPAAERLFGYRADEVLGRNVNILMPEPHRGAHDGYLQRYLASGVPHVIGTGAQVTGLRRDGTPVPLHLAVTEMRLGTQRLFTGILHDLTDQRAAQQRQDELIQDLRNVNEELRSFAYVVSHDLKAPLRGIGSLADWLVSDYTDKLDDQGREYLTLMKGRVTRMDALIDGILEYSRVGRVQQPPVEVDLNALVADVLQMLAPPPQMVVRVEAALPTVVGERVRLQQVFQNLISNAIRHRDKPEGHVQVSCRDAGDDWQFSIADDGPGIEPRHHERIFQLFQVLTPRDRKESTGVGLALVKKIVETHGGRVWVESRPGQGSTFHFTLPKQRPQTEGEPTP